MEGKSIRWAGWYVVQMHPLIRITLTNLISVRSGAAAYLRRMLTEKEEAFLAYWEANRDRQKKLMYQLLVGLPVGLLLCAIITFNFYSGWYKRATMVADSKFDPVVLIVALLIIAVFIAVFSKKFQWDQQQQRYLELMAKKNKQDKTKNDQV